VPIRWENKGVNESYYMMMMIYIGATQLPRPVKMHLYTHKALLSSCMDEPHDVWGGWLGVVVLLCQTPCCKPSHPQAKARMNDVAP